jgi:hypothetical protein
VEHLKETGVFEDSDRQNNTKMDLKEQDVTACNEFIWLKIRVSGRLL